MAGRLRVRGAVHWPDTRGAGLHLFLAPRLWAASLQAHRSSWEAFELPHDSRNHTDRCILGRHAHTAGGASAPRLQVNHGFVLIHIQIY